MKCRLVFLAGLVACSTPAYADTASDHQNMLNAHGAQVMPFDMKTAMHMFTPNATGGTVEIMVHDMDTQQIALVRQHLSAEAAKFATGNYSDPAYIHGSSMPGLQVLAANSTTISVRYSDTRMGGKIELTTKDAASIAAIHQWLAAQATDHSAGDGHNCDMSM